MLCSASLKSEPGHLRVLHSYKVYRPELDGGIPYVIATLAEAGDSEIENQILVARLKGFGRRFTVNNVPVEAVTSLGTYFSTPLAPTYSFRLAARSKAHDIVVLHAPFPLADFSSPWIGSKTKLIVYWHADIVGYSLLKKLVMPAIRRTLLRADRIIVADQTMINNSVILAEFAHKCTIVPYGTNTDYWSSQTSEEAARSGILREKYPKMILAIGRLVSYKGFDVLLDALKSVDGHLVLIGEGPLDQSLRDQARKLRLSDRVNFAGRLVASEIKAHIHAAKVLAFPSVTSAEAFGIVQIEAMAAGLPVVNTALKTAVPRIARHNREAITVQPHDSTGLAKALTKVLTETDFASRMAAACQIRSREEYSRAAYLSRIKDVFYSALTKKLSADS